MKVKDVFALSLAALGLIASVESQAANYSEFDSVDLPNNPAAPGSLLLDFGSNLVVGAFGGGDPADFLTVMVPVGYQLSAIMLGQQTIVGSNSSFIGIQAGPVVTSTSSPAALLGWTHFRSVQIGTDILDDISVGPGALGFSRPLGAGAYTIWVQELSGDAGLRYDFDFQVTAVPLPAAIWLLASGVFGLVGFPRKRKGLQ